MQKPSLFIGSSTEGLPFAEAVARSLCDVADTVLWNDGNIFTLGRTFIESLLLALSRFDFAALVLTPDDPLLVRNDQTLGPRDNIVFELGLFMGGLGRERTFIVRPETGSLKIPSDLAGISAASFAWPHPDGDHDAALQSACDSMRRSIRILGFAPSRANAEVRALRDEQLEQQKQIEALQFLVRNFITEHELTHLKKLANNKRFDFRPAATFESELRHLLAMGLIRRLPGKGIRSMMAAADDVRNHLEITDSGRHYLTLREKQ